MARNNKGAALNPRLRESVRRAIYDAGEALGWAALRATSKDPLGAVVKDVKKLMKSGITSLQRSVTEDLAENKTEITRLHAVVKSLRALAASPKTVYPVEITYYRSANSIGDGMVTKTETATLASGDEATTLGDQIERSLPKWEKLRDAMGEELKERRKSLERLTASHTEVVDGWRGMIQEVMATIL